MNRQCSKPTTVYQLVGRKTPKGKAVIVYGRPDPKTPHVAFPRPCGKCLNCRNRRRMDLAVRLTHESRTHKHTAFVTLTYDRENLPYGNTLVPKHLTQFIKAIRNRGYKVRFFGAGEYGTENSRPHYHCLIFGLKVPDAELMSVKKGRKYYGSEFLKQCWGRGHIDLTFPSDPAMMYVTKYHIDKVGGDLAEKHYEWLVEETGEIIQRHPEFARMSNRPGLGAKWFEKHYTDFYPSGFTVINGAKVPAPPYYDRLLERKDPELLEIVKQARLEHALDPRELTGLPAEARGYMAEKEARMQRTGAL